MLSHPGLPLPAPLRASEIPSFTHYSVTVRLPDIARRTLAENHFPPPVAASIQALIDEIGNGRIRPIAVPLAPDQALWETWMQPYLGMTWLEVPWFFAEEYFYRRILEATGYFTDGEGQHRDPYARQKELGLESSREQIRDLARHAEDVQENPLGESLETLERLLLVDLWGNQNDLSMWPVQAASAPHRQGDKPSAGGLTAAQEHILANDLPALMPWFERLGAHAHVGILLDNGGYELVADLVLADFLNAIHRAAQVVLHAKTYPVFVSDATEADIHTTIDSLFADEEAVVKDLAMRLRAYLFDGRLSLRQHPFWTSPLAMWEMPGDLAEEIEGTQLLIAKGDANYRRLLGDRHWETHLPFSAVVSYLPCGILALRTLKSEIAVGIDPTRVPTSDPDWMTDGKWGLVQFAHPR